ncbi:MAG: hypothetical protein IJU47_02890, partial [Verrucomicrobia bacterium]|nr:hypothetical protein [Verrucomicrobiota bacterium]
MLEKNNRFNYGVDSGRGNAQNLSNLQNAYSSGRPSWLSTSVKGAVLGLGLATLLPLTAFADGPAGFEYSWPTAPTVGGNNLETVVVNWIPDPNPTQGDPEGIHLPYGTPINDQLVLDGQITVTKADGTPIDDPTATGKFQFVVEKVLYPVGGPYNIFAYYFLDPEKSELKTDDYDGRQHQYLFVDPAVAELEWATPEAITYGTPLSDVQLNAKCVTIDVSTIGTAAGGPNGKILTGTFTYDPAAGTILDAGTHTLNVTFVPDNPNYLEATATVEIVVNKADLTDDQFSWGDPTLDTLTYGDEFTTDNIHYTTTFAGTITTDPDMLDTYPNAGEYPLTLTFTPDNQNYNPAVADRTLIVKKATPVIEWETPDRVEKGTQFARNATAAGIEIPNAPAAGAREDVEGDFVYDPTLPVTLDQVPEQTLTVTFTPTGNSATNYEAVTVTRTVEVFTKVPVTITWATPLDIYYGTALGLAMEMDQRGILDPDRKIQLNALAKTEDGTKVDGRYVYIPEEGNILPAGRHELKVTFTPTDSDTYETATGSVWINVLKATPIVTWDPLSPITYGTPLSGDQLNAEFTWTIGGQDVVVDGTPVYTPADGEILPVGENRLSVTFTPTDTDNYEVVTATATVVVEKEDPTIEWGDQAGKLQDIVYGTALKLGEQLNAVAKDSTGAEIPGTYAYDPAEGTILNAADDQPITVTFTPESDNYSTATKTVTINVLKATPIVTWEPTTPITYGTPLSDDQLNATFTWTVEGQGEVTVEGTATYEPVLDTVLPVGTQTLKLTSFVASGDTYRPEHPENYETVDAEVQIEVEKATLVITIDDKSILFNADAPEYTYQPIEGFVNGDTVESVFEKAPVAISDYVKGDPVGTYPIYMDPAPTADNYDVDVEEGTLTVGVKEPDIIWIKPDPIIQGTALVRDDSQRGIKADGVQLNALAVEDKNADPLVEITGTYVYEPAEGTADLPLGENILSVTFTPDQQYADNYKAATAVVVLLVQAKPVIEWADPQEIGYTDENGARSTMGELLNATVKVGNEDISNLGNFVYTWTKSGNVIKPTANTPEAGEYADHLKVEFVVNETLTEYAQPDPVIVDLIVKKGTPVIAWNPKKLGPNEPVPAGMEIPEAPVYQLPDITYGTELTDADQLNAYVCKSKTNTGKSSMTGSMIYTVPATKLPAGWNTLYVTFTPTGSYAKNYEAVTVFNLIYVEYAELSDDDVTWVDAPFTVPYGTKLNVIKHYTLTAEVDGKKIEGTAINKKMDGQDASEIEDAPAVGTYTLTATFDPDKNSEPSKNYKAKDKTTTFTVEKATPNIDLIDEDPQQPNTITIVYGTAIDDKFAAETFIATNPVDDAIEVGGTYTFDVFEQVEDPSTQSGWRWFLIEKDLTQEYLDVVINYEDPAPYQIVAHFTPDDGDTYENATSERYDLFVIPADPEIDAENPIEIPYGTELTEASFKAAVTGVDEEEVDGDLTYFVGDTELSQLTQPLGKGTYEGTVKFASNDTNYNDGSAKVTIYVYGSVYIEWTPAVWDAEKEQAQIEFGTPLTKADQLNAVALDAEDRTTVVDGDMEYEIETKDGGKLPAVDGMTLPAGTYTLWAEFTPDDTDKYDPTSKPVTLVVVGKDPHVSWYPFPLFYGQTPGDGQYNARADVSGQFDYPEQPEWPVEPGVWHLDAPFTPEDKNYADSVAHGVLVIMKAPIRFEWPAQDLYYGETPTAEKQFNARVYSVATNEDITDKGEFEYPINELTDESPVGVYTLVAPWHLKDQKDADRYESGIAYANVEVLGADPAADLTWNPEALPYGEKASDKQKNASSGTIAGHFEYPNMDGYNVGEYEVTANFISEDPNYTNAEVTATLKVVKATPVITWNDPADIDYGTALSGNQLNATANADGTFDYSPAAGTILPSGENTLTVTFTPTDTENYNTATATATIYVEMAVPTVTVDDPVSITYGDLIDDAAAGATASVAGTFTYSVKVPVVVLSAVSEDETEEAEEEYVDVDPSVERLDAGEYTLAVLFTPEDTANYEAVMTYTTLIVDPAEVDVVIDSDSFIYGTTLTPESFGANAYGIDGEEVAGSFELYLDGELVDEAGVAPGLGEHTLTVVFTSEDSNYADPEEAIEVTINVNPSADLIEVEWDVPAVITYDDVIELNAKAINTVDGSVLAEGDELIYNIFEDGVELPEGTILDAGEYQVKAIFVGAGEYEGIEKDTDWLPVTVEPAEPTLSWNPAPLTYGSAATAAQENASANVAGQFVYPNMSGLPVGENEVTAKFISGDPNFADGEVSAILKVTKATPVIRWATPAPINYGTLLSDEQLNASANVDGTFKYTPAAGTELDIGTYTLIAEFTPKDTANYTTATASVELEVIPNVEVEITWEPKSPITYGTVLSVEQLNATANVEGHFYYNPTY